MRRRPLLVACLLVGYGVITNAQRTPPIDVTLLLSRLADAVVAYYSRAQSIMWDEIESQQQLTNGMPNNAPMRTVQSELRLSWEPTENGSQPEANVLRRLVRVNNRPPRDKDKNTCLDPTAESQDVLSMFLPDNQRDYVFVAAGTGKVDGRQAVMLDYRPRTMGKPSIAWKAGKDDCVTWSLAGHTRGRVWIDPETAEALRLEEHLVGLLDFDVPPHAKRLNQFERLTIERFDVAIKFRRFAFTDPDESLLLPASHELISIVRSSTFASVRVRQEFKNYRRFMTGIRIVQ
ncbi:MAG: hypothetical protein ABMA15_11640 [Vicinamibacterales bacterium]